jgi:type II secretory pathway pseudopilin PulG
MRYSIYNVLNINPVSGINASSTWSGKGLTLVEMIIALSLMTIVFASVVPLFGQMSDSWDSKQAAAETLQNGRILMEHIQRNLSKAVRIISVSDSSETDGFMEFENNNSEILRYDINTANSNVEFGLAGDLSELAGPVSSLQFTCYDACDLDTPMSTVADTNSIRVVKVGAIFTNQLSSQQDKTFSACIYIRTNVNSGSGSTTESAYDYSNRIQGTNILAYDGQNNQKVPTDSSTPSNVLNSSEYDGIELNDGSFHVFSISQNGRYGLMRFVFIIDENKSDVSQISALWNGKSVNEKGGKADGASLYIWNYTNSDYEPLEASADTENEITLNGELTSGLTEYIGGAGNNTITLLVVTNDQRTSNKSYELFTDYVKLDIFASTGGSGIYP